MLKSTTKKRKTRTRDMSRLEPLLLPLLPPPLLLPLLLLLLRLLLLLLLLQWLWWLLLLLLLRWLVVLYASTWVTFHLVLCHSRHLSVIPVTCLSLLITIVLPFIIVTFRLFVFCSSSRIYSAPVMLRASFLSFVAGLSYLNIFTFLWLDN